MGIDYGMGRANIGKHGVRYGVLPPSLAPDWLDSESETEYPPIEYDCPNCCHTITEETGDEYSECPACGEDVRDRREATYDLDEPSGFNYTSEGVQLFKNGGDNDWWIFESPYVIRGSYCSPCAPGAIYINGGGDDNWAYCIPPEWFDEDTLAAMENKPVRIETVIELEVV